MVGMSESPQARLKAAYVPIGQVRIAAKGWAKVCAFRAIRAGAYTSTLRTASGTAYYVKVTVRKKEGRAWPSAWAARARWWTMGVQVLPPWGCRRGCSGAVA